MEKDLSKILYEPPRAEIVQLHCCDVIATSGPLSNDDGSSHEPDGWV